MTSPPGKGHEHAEDGVEGDGTDALEQPIGHEQRLEQEEAATRGEAEREVSQVRPGGTP